MFNKKVPGLVYANAYGDGIYKSTDAGVTWSKIAGSPSQVNRMALASNSVLYVTHKLGVSKYANGLWSRITPTNAKTGFNALSVDPNNPDRLLIAYDQYHQTKHYCRVFQSTNGGATWEQKKHSLKPQVSWWAPTGILARRPQPLNLTRKFAQGLVNRLVWNMADRQHQRAEVCLVQL
jgi:photosystem II stability/assembly factor-like uncharacterized protein